MPIGDDPPLSPTARRFARDVKFMGGQPIVRVTRRGPFGTLGQAESFHTSFDGPRFDDSALARLAMLHGDRIDSLAIEYTSVTGSGWIRASALNPESTAPISRRRASRSGDILDHC